MHQIARILDPLCRVAFSASPLGMSWSWYLTGPPASSLWGTSTSEIPAVASHGRSWTAVCPHLFGVSFADPDEGWVVGASGTILHTADGGDTHATATAHLYGEFSGALGYLPAMGYDDDSNHRLSPTWNTGISGYSRSRRRERCSDTSSYHLRTPPQ